MYIKHLEWYLDIEKAQLGLLIFRMMMTTMTMMMEEEQTEEKITMIHSLCKDETDFFPVGEVSTTVIKLSL